MPNGRKCVITWCKNHQNPEKGHTLFRFPLDGPMAQKWCDALGVESRRDIPATACVCSLHFERSCFYPGPSIRCLVPDAVPSLHVDHYKSKFVLTSVKDASENQLAEKSRPSLISLPTLSAHNSFDSGEPLDSDTSTGQDTQLPSFQDYSEFFTPEIKVEVDSDVGENDSTDNAISEERQEINAESHLDDSNDKDSNESSEPTVYTQSTRKPRKPRKTRKIVLSSGDTEKESEAERNKSEKRSHESMDNVNQAVSERSLNEQGSSNDIPRPIGVVTNISTKSKVSGAEMQGKDKQWEPVPITIAPESRGYTQRRMPVVYPVNPAARKNPPAAGKPIKVVSMESVGGLPFVKTHPRSVGTEENTTTAIVNESRVSSPPANIPSIKPLVIIPNENVSQNNMPVRRLMAFIKRAEPLPTTVASYNSSAPNVQPIIGSVLPSSSDINSSAINIASITTPNNSVSASFLPAAYSTTPVRNSSNANMIAAITKSVMNTPITTVSPLAASPVVPPLTSGQSQQLNAKTVVNLKDISPSTSEDKGTRNQQPAQGAPDQGIYLGRYHEFWQQYRKEMGFKSHEEFAGYMFDLLDHLNTTGELPPKTMPPDRLNNREKFPSDPPENSCDSEPFELRIAVRGNKANVPCHVIVYNGVVWSASVSHPSPSPNIYVDSMVNGTDSRQRPFSKVKISLKPGEGSEAQTSVSNINSGGLRNNPAVYSALGGQADNLGSDIGNLSSAGNISGVRVPQPMISLQALGESPRVRRGARRGRPSRSRYPTLSFRRPIIREDTKCLNENAYSNGVQEDNDDSYSIAHHYTGLNVLNNDRPKKPRTPVVPSSVVNMSSPSESYEGSPSKRPRRAAKRYSYTPDNEVSSDSNEKIFVKTEVDSDEADRKIFKPTVSRRGRPAKRGRGRPRGSTKKLNHKSFDLDKIYDSQLRKMLLMQEGEQSNGGERQTAEAKAKTDFEGVGDSVDMNDKSHLSDALNDDTGSVSEHDIFNEPHHPKLGKFAYVSDEHWVCCLCFYRGTDAYKMMAHLDYSHGEYCKNIDLVMNEILDHSRMFGERQEVSEVDSSTEKNVCSLCLNKLIVGDFRAHVLKFHGKKALENDVFCRSLASPLITAASKGNMLDHYSAVAGYFCNACSDQRQLMTGNSHLAKHVLKHDAELHACDLCEESFENLDSYVNHMHFTHTTASNLVYCEHCSYCSLQHSKVRMHERVMHPLILQCSMENCSFETVSEFQCRQHIINKHMKRHPGDMLVVLLESEDQQSEPEIDRESGAVLKTILVNCHLCSLAIKCKTETTENAELDEVAEHFVCFHQDYVASFQRVFSCDNCEKKFFTKEQLVSHLASCGEQS